MITGTVLHTHKATVIESTDYGIAVQFRHAANSKRVEWIDGAKWPVGTQGRVSYIMTNRSGIWKFEAKSDGTKIDL